MELWAFFLALGITARLTRFFNSDILANGFRNWVDNGWGEDSKAPQWLRRAFRGGWGEDSKISWLVSCPWCLSIWWALPVAVAAWFACPALHQVGAWWFVIPGIWLSTSYVYSLVATNLDS